MATAAEIKIIAGTPELTSTGVRGGVDVPIKVQHGGAVWSGVVTLVRRESDGEWSSWGSRDHWCSSEIIEAANALDFLHGDSRWDSGPKRIAPGIL